MKSNKQSRKLGMAIAGYVVLSSNVKIKVFFYSRPINKYDLGMEYGNFTIGKLIVLLFRKCRS